MICAVSLNPAVDKYVRLPRLRRGEPVQAEEVITSAGGKAINVAGVLRELGEEVELIGFFGGFTGAYLIEQVARGGVRIDRVEIAGLTRTAFVIVEDDGKETEVVAPGGAVAPGELQALREKVRRASHRAAVMVLSGSVPPGCPADVYVRLLEDCAGRCPVIVDTSRAWLRAVLDARGGPRPSMIKPNRREAEAVLGYMLAAPAACERALCGFAARGVTRPVISDGAAGLCTLAEGKLWRAFPPMLTAVNSVGSGDAAVAGFARGLARGESVEDMLRLAAACGAANALTKECAQVRRRD